MTNIVYNNDASNIVAYVAADEDYFVAVNRDDDGKPLGYVAHSPYDKVVCEEAVEAVEEIIAMYEADEEVAAQVAADDAAVAAAATTDTATVYMPFFGTVRGKIINAEIGFGLSDGEGRFDRNVVPSGFTTVWAQDARDGQLELLSRTTGGGHVEIIWGVSSDWSYAVRMTSSDYADLLHKLA